MSTLLAFLGVWAACSLAIGLVWCAVNALTRRRKPVPKPAPVYRGGSVRVRAWVSNYTPGMWRAPDGDYYACCAQGATDADIVDILVGAATVYADDEPESYGV